MGRTKPITIHRGPDKRTTPQDTVVRTEDRQEQYSLNNMQRSMEEELEKKRLEWELEVKAMQSDFFNLKTNENGNAAHGNTGLTEPSSVAVVPENDIIRCARTPPLSERNEDNKKFIQRFDLHGFDAEDISLRVEGRKLHVEGQKESDEGPGRKSTKRFRRQVDVPLCVDVDKLTSSFSCDGLLSVEAPLEERPPPSILSQRNESLPNPPDYHSVTRGVQPECQYGDREIYPSDDRYSGLSSSRTHDMGSRYPSQYEGDIYRSMSPSRNLYIKTSSSPARSMFKTMTPSSMIGSMVHSPSNRVVYSSSPTYSPNSMFSHFNSPSIITVNETKKLKLNVDVGRDFDPEDIKVKLERDAKRIKVQADKEEVINGRSTKREFSREFELPERMEASTLRASLDAHGRLFIGGSLMSNKDHMQALDSVNQDLPSHATPVRVQI